MPGFQELLDSQHHLTTYHLYHDGPGHILISPEKQSKDKRKVGKLNTTKDAGDTTTTHPQGSFYMHRPFLSFHNAPRTLRHGSAKTGAPICIMNDSPLWGRWNLQFGEEELAQALDPRGVVAWQSRSNANNSRDNDDTALKGYKVRRWRLWGESGKAYHREVNAARKHDKPVLHRQSSDKGSSAASCTEDEGETHDAVRAAYTSSLKWVSPISSRTRWYQLTYDGIDLVWKGTRDLRRGQTMRQCFMPFHHLKLVARLPPLFVGDRDSEVLLAQYSSSWGSEKHGSLVILDEVVSRIFDRGRSLSESSGLRGAKRADHLERVYQLILTTALCMIVGEGQKRGILLALLALIAEGVGS
ncbi:hypothetical protein P168DRAFT_287602 [Aspergillus campestris IBT 28561]|uniref:Uncharacterized protein n=1 Tax=Aspergillus campestris (strain IBT 28561) TaxID=1392248 RepID=A0A2I1DB57_ASPC2|nr:uncharacterized protein P168DRAFT_287602 [Aspergillus campestris IBT 28561]PKY07108.1 hypothetical protein P168DRAFT_287602 [Aspergillus campestris IBT 28561]